MTGVQTCALPISLHAVCHVVAVNVVGLLGDAKVGDFARAVEIEENVVGFEVAVQDTFTM